LIGALHSPEQGKLRYPSLGAGNVTRTPAYHINYLANAVGRDEKLAGEG